MYTYHWSFLRSAEWQHTKICICIYMYTYKYTYVYIYICICMHVYISISIFISIYIDVYIFVCIYIYVYVYAHICPPFIHPILKDRGSWTDKSQRNKLTNTQRTKQVKTQIQHTMDKNDAVARLRISNCALFAFDSLLLVLFYKTFIKRDTIHVHSILFY